MGAKAIRQPASYRAHRAARKGKTRSQQGGLSDGKVVCRVEILWHPDRQRSEPSEDDRIVLAVLPNAPVRQHGELMSKRGNTSASVPTRIRDSEDPKDDSCNDKRNS